MALSKERANELLSKTIKQYVSLVDGVGHSKSMDNVQVCNDLKIGKKELKELGLNFDNRR